MYVDFPASSRIPELEPLYKVINVLSLDSRSTVSFTKSSLCLGTTISLDDRHWISLILRERSFNFFVTKSFNLFLHFAKVVISS